MRLETRQQREDRLSRGRNPRTTTSRKNKPTYFWWEPSQKDHTFLIRTHMYHKQANHLFGALPQNEKLYNTVRNEWDMGPIIVEVPRDGAAYDYTPPLEEEDFDDYDDGDDDGLIPMHAPATHPQPSLALPHAVGPRTSPSTPPSSPPHPLASHPSEVNY